MEILVDAEGFIKPVVFLAIAIVILFMSYKKKIRYAWLAFLPILGMWLYDDYKEEVRIENEQEQYLVNTWDSIYRPLYLQAWVNEDRDSEAFDEWILQTDGGEYYVRFHQGETDGYEMYEVVWEDESLTGRKNALEIIDTLGIKGPLTYDKDTYTYTVNDGKNEYNIEMNNKGRVNHVSDENGETIFQNEENDLKPEGRPLTEEEVG